MAAAAPAASPVLSRPESPRRGRPRSVHLQQRPGPAKRILIFYAWPWTWSLPQEMKSVQQALSPRPLRLRRERLRRGWSQFHTGTLANIEPATVAQIESGRRFPYPGWRKRLAAAFDLPEELLFAPADEDDGR